MEKKTIIGVIGFFTVLTIVLCLLIPVEERNKRIEKWGELGEMSETNSMAEFIIENEELYTEDILSIFYDNNEELEFVYNYAFHKDDYKTMAFTNSELNSEDIPALYMDDTRWAYEKIYDEYIVENGCATVAITMANLYLNHNSDVDPVKVTEKAKELNAFTMFEALSAVYVADIVNSFDMNVEDFNCYENDLLGVEHNDLITALDEENAVVMANMMSETFGNHMIIIREYTDEGYYINDPADPEKTAQLWDYETIEKDVAYYWIITRK